MKVFLVNQRRKPEDPRLFAELEYDFGGNTKRLPPDSETEVSEPEAQLVLSRWQNAGVSVRYEK